jgi:hypothetical protein
MVPITNLIFPLHRMRGVSLSPHLTPTRSPAPVGEANQRNKPLKEIEQSLTARHVTGKRLRVPASPYRVSGGSGLI